LESTSMGYSFCYKIKSHTKQINLHHNAFAMGKLKFSNW
jgi:hypothetical protein